VSTTTRSLSGASVLVRRTSTDCATEVSWPYTTSTTRRCTTSRASYTTTSGDVQHTDVVERWTSSEFPAGFGETRDIHAFD